MMKLWPNIKLIAFVDLEIETFLNFTGQSVENIHASTYKFINAVNVNF